MKNNIILITIIILIYGCNVGDHPQDETILSETDTSKLNVALLQLDPHGADMEKNMLKGDKYCREAAEMGADIILFPEMWNIGYSRYHWPGTRYTPDKYDLSFEEWKSRAIDTTHTFIKHFQKLAKELNVAIVITYLEKWDPLPRNSATVIDPTGHILMTYAKVHTSDMKATESNCTPGEDFYVCNLPVNNDTVKLGIMTCFDREFPESARILMLKGAELVLTPNACTLEEKRLNQFQTRAVENAFGVAMTNYPEPSQNGHSCAYDGDGDKLLVAGEEEGVFMASFNMEEIRKHRAKTSWGNAYRRPHRYQLILSNEVDSIFVRENGLGERFQRKER